MSHTESFPSSGATDLAFDTWENVHGENGELALAAWVLGQAMDGLHYLQSTSISPEENKEFESLVHNLLATINQREITANEFIEVAAAELNQ